MRFTQADWVVHPDDRSEKKPLQSITSVSPSADGTRVATGALDSKLRIWSTAPILDEAAARDEATNPRLLCTGTAHNGAVMCVRFSSTGNRIASGADDRILAVWERQDGEGGKKVWGTNDVNVETWKPIRLLAGHTNDVLSVAWSDDDAFLASGGSDLQVLVWDGNTFAPIRKLELHSQFIKGIVFDPVGEYLATQDFESLKVWRTKDWQLENDIKEPFTEAPNQSWFTRPTWSPDGTHIVVPNAMNGPVFVAKVVNRPQWTSDTSLVGHNAVVEVAAFNPLLFLKDPKKPFAGDNFCTLLALGAQSSISFWLTTSSRPLFVMHDVCARDLLDLQWSSDGTKLWFSSSDGHVGVIEFDLSEIPAQVAPAGSAAAFHASFGFDKPVREKVVVRESTPQASQASQAAMSGPQKTTVMANGKKRIQPKFMGALQAVQQTFDGTSTSSTPVFPTNPLPAAPANRSKPALTATPSFTSLPSARASSDRQSVFANANAAPAQPTASGSTVTASPATAATRKGSSLRNAVYDAEPLYASSSRARDQLPPVMDIDFAMKPRLNRHPRGPTLGGSWDKEKGKGVDVTETELAPSFLPTALNPEDYRLAVPSIMTYGKAPMNQVTLGEADDNVAVERLEWRNFKDGANRPSEVALYLPDKAGSSGQEKTMWLDYLEHKVVAATWNGVFGAVGTLDGSLSVYSPSGRKIMPALLLNAPCAYLDAAGDFLLAITARGRMHIWNIKQSRAVSSPANVSEVLSSSSSTPATITSARIRPNGSPVLALSDGRALAYDGDLSCWLTVSSTWWSKGSDFWEGRTRGRNNTARGLMRTIEGSVNDMIAKDVSDQAIGIITAMDVDEPISIEGEEQQKLGHEEDWKAAMSLGHLESRMAACRVLDSPGEYKTFLLLYAQRLGTEGFRNKAEELIRELMGPVYYKPGGADTWQPQVLGMGKRDLLREILNGWTKSTLLKRLATDTQELLRRVTD